MNYELSKYKKEWAIFCKASRSYIMFGKRKELKKRIEELNSERYD